MCRDYRSQPLQSGDGEKPNSPKVKVQRSVDSKFDFFKSLRLDEGLIDSDSEKSSYENGLFIGTFIGILLSSSSSKNHLTNVKTPRSYSAAP